MTDPIQGRSYLLFLFLPCAVLFVLRCDMNPRETHQVTLSASDGEIPAGLAFVAIPEAWKEESNFTLEPVQGGKAMVAQKWDAGRAAFILPESLGQGESLQYKISPNPSAERGSVQIFENSGQIQVSGEPGPILIYQIKTVPPPPGSPEYYKRSGFIHPVYSPSGTILTDDFPAGHTHQHALFMAWVNTTFHGEKVDFWNQQDQSGTVEYRRVLDKEEGPVFGRFRVEHAYVSTKFGAALREVWTVTAYPMGKETLFDIRSEQETAGAEPLHLNEYHYGGMAFRGSAQWNHVDSTSFVSPMRVLTSEGKATPDEANHSRPRWTAGYGPVDGKTSGLAILDHPDNFRHPQPVRVHPDMPYFCLTPMVEGAFDIVQGEKYISTYRFVSFDGEPEPEILETLWQSFANPPVATLK